VCAEPAVPIEVRLYDQLFTVPDLSSIPEGKTYLDYLNPDSLKTIPTAMAESSLSEADPGLRYQFLRLGYFTLDKDSAAVKMIFNRICGLRDNWVKQMQKSN
jgi:glutaminyl-tRNA synthetase